MNKELRHLLTADRDPDDPWGWAIGLSAAQLSALPTAWVDR